MQTIWLFDIDGVLVHPGGYQAALKATVNHFSQAMGLGDLAPDDETIQVFEACGLTSEWDSSPMCAAILLLEAALADPLLAFEADFWRSVERVQARRLPVLLDSRILDRYQTLARRVAETRQPEELAGQAVLRLLTEELKSGAQFDGRTAALAGLLSHLLTDTRKFPHAPGMYIFQHYALGSQVFAETYQMPAEFDYDGLLATHDRPALSAESLTRVQALLSAGLRACLFTARPCFAPRDLASRLAGFSPEAELAARLSGLAGLPLIGFGSLQWLGRETQRHPEEFLKPSPVHALAAIAAAMALPESEALRAAHALVEHGETHPIWQRLAEDGVALHVFEDSIGGVRALRAAGERLAQLGVKNQVYAWGIAAHPPKAQALREQGAVVLSSLDEAVVAASATIG